MLFRLRQAVVDVHSLALAHPAFRQITEGRRKFDLAVVSPLFNEVRKEPN